MRKAWGCVQEGGGFLDSRLHGRWTVDCLASSCKSPAGLRVSVSKSVVA